MAGEYAVIVSTSTGVERIMAVTDTLEKASKIADNLRVGFEAVTIRRCK